MKIGDLRLLLSMGSGRRLFFASITGALFWSALVITNAYLLSEIIVGTIDHKGPITVYITVLAALWIVRALFQSYFDLWSLEQAIEIKEHFRSEATSHIENYSSQSSSLLSNVLTKGLNSLDIYFGRFIPQVIFASLTPLIVIATLFYQDVLSGFIAVVTLPLIPFFGALIGKYSSESVMRKWQTLGVLSAYFEDSLRGFITLKIFGRSNSQSQRIGKMGDAYTEETMKVLRISFLSAFALELIATLSVAVIAVSVGLRLVSGSMDFASALVVLILAPEVYFPVRNAASLFHASQDATQALEDLASIRAEDDIEVENANLPAEEITAISWEASEIRRGQHEVVNIAEGRVNQGELCFIVAPSGMGKTTFAHNLLASTFQTPIRAHCQDDSFLLEPCIQLAWQRLVGWVPQNPQLASGSVRDQFLLIEQATTDKKINDLLQQAGLSEYDLPQGLDTELGQGGESSHFASGGQIKRIALARALLRRPRIIVADEPTSDLDDASADAVMATLRTAAAAGAIVICITHDQEAIGLHDRVCVLERSTT